MKNNKIVKFILSNKIVIGLALIVSIIGYFGQEDYKEKYDKLYSDIQTLQSKTNEIKENKEIDDLNTEVEKLEKSNEELNKTKEEKDRILLAAKDKKIEEENKLKEEEDKRIAKENEVKNQHNESKENIDNNKNYNTENHSKKEQNGVNNRPSGSKPQSNPGNLDNLNKPSGNSTPNVTGGTVYWTPKGKSYHKSRNCTTLKRSKTVYSGTIGESGKDDPCNVCCR